MAGAGYKLFATGDVLTASDVNTYLMQQTVMVFADAAARTTALSGVVAEGMLSYLKDTNAVEVYDGANWVASDDPNAIQNTIVDAKGDLITATGADVPARLAVGSNGDTLVADSAATTGLRWQGDYAAGKNKIINGDFGINQRAFTSNTTSGTFNFDRWSQLNVGGTVTCTPQVFTPGAAPVVGYEGTNFLQTVTASQSAAGDLAIVGTKLEDVRLFAGQTITMSFYARATSGTPKIGMEINQNFGSGGSSEFNNILGAVTLSTSWARYSITHTVASITGKTIGTSSYLQAYLWLSAGSTYTTRSSAIGIQNNTFQIWGVQLEAGSVATAFQTATGTLQGELAACQRYYYRIGGTGSTERVGFGTCTSTTNAEITIPAKSSFRVAPTAVDYSSLQTFDGVNVNAITAVALTGNASGKEYAIVSCTVASGLAQFRPVEITATSTSGYIGFSAEL